MKKLLGLLLSLLLVVSLSACTEKFNTGKKTESEALTTSDSETVDNKEEQKEEQTDTKEDYTAKKVKVIDIDGLQAVEAADTFGLKVSSVEGVEGVYADDSSRFLSGEDGIIVKIKNNINTKVQNFTILILCTDENKEGCDLGVLSSFNHNVTIQNNKVVSYSNYVKIMGTESAELDPGTEKEYAIQCKLDKIKNVNAIVYSYVDGLGNEVVNENYVNWLEKTYEATVY